MEFFKVDMVPRGIAVVTFDRPPVNAVSWEVCYEIIELAETVGTSRDVRVIVLTGAPRCRAWMGGADVNDQQALDRDRSLARLQVMDRLMRALYDVERPVIAAINSHAVGIGMVLAALCDIRVASSEAFFAIPEIDRGLVLPTNFWVRLGMPAGKVREMILTAGRYTAEDLRYTGFFDYIVPRDQVLPKALEIAQVMAKKSLPWLKSVKSCCNAAEQMQWQDAFGMARDRSARLFGLKDRMEGIQAFLEKREPVFKDE